MDCTISPFGRFGNETILLYTFVTASGLELSIMNYGATITTINLRKGYKSLNLVYGYKNFNPYITSKLHAGGIIGRYANRINGAVFEINGRSYRLTANENGNTLHGGNCGFDSQVWQTQLFESVKGVSTLVFYLRSTDGENGFPGNLDVWATYQITDDNQICINYLARTDHPTHVNLTSHSYFNLSGFASNINDLLLQINADSYLQLDASTKIPTGKLLNVAHTPFNFKKPVQIGSNLQQMENGEFDNCFVLNEPRLSKPSVKLMNTKIGVNLSLYTNQPGLQLYTPLVKPTESQVDMPFNDGCWAVCLEPQHFPNTPNMPQFPSTLIKPDDEYNCTSIYSFDFGR